MYRIIFELFNEHGEKIGYGRYPKLYHSEEYAVEKARIVFSDPKRFRWFVVEEDDNDGYKLVLPSKLKRLLIIVTRLSKMPLIIKRRTKK